MLFADPHRQDWRGSLCRLRLRLEAVLGLAPPPPRTWLRQDREDNCTQTVVSMITGLSVEEVHRRSGREGTMSVSVTLRLLSQCGFAARPVASQMAADFWPVFRKRHGGLRLRGLGIRLAHAGEEHGHAYFLYGRRIYDPETGRFAPLNPEAIRSLDYVALFRR